MKSLVLGPRKDDLSREIESLFSNFFNAPAFWSERNGIACPAVDIHEGKEDITLTFEIPGMEKKDIKVAVENDILTVSGERNFHEEEKDRNYIRTEIRNGSFSRSFTLPKGVDTGKISAEYKNGFLEVKLAKTEETKPKEVEVKVS